MPNPSVGWMLVLTGLAIGLLWVFVPWFGRLPGDIRIEGSRGSFYFPVVTCLLLSAVLSLAMWLVRMFLR